MDDFPQHFCAISYFSEFESECQILGYTIFYSDVHPITNFCAILQYFRLAMSRLVMAWVYNLLIAMDSNLAYMYLQMQADEDDKLDNEEKHAATILILTLALGVEEARQTLSHRQNPSCLFLCRQQLLPNPRGQTPWQILFSSRCDWAYITTMGFDVKTFNYILNQRHSLKWNSIVIPQNDTNLAGAAWPSCCSLNVAGALGLILHYLNLTMHKISLQQIFALVPACISRYVAFALKILAELLQSIHEAHIRWPSDLPTICWFNNLITTQHPLLVGTFGSVDGLNLLVQESMDVEIENATYNGWMATHNISSILVFLPEGVSFGEFSVLIANNTTWVLFWQQC